MQSLGLRMLLQLFNWAHQGLIVYLPQQTMMEKEDKGEQEKFSLVGLDHRECEGSSPGGGGSCATSS